MSRSTCFCHRPSALAAIVTLIALGGTSRALAAPTVPLRNGDLIFQTSASDQSLAILWATKSRYSHVGLIARRGGKSFVVEAVGPVKVTPLAEFIRRGVLGRYTILRYRGISDQQAGAVVEKARNYLGRPYDRFFLFDKASIYCSELVYLAFKDAGLEVGEIQELGELDVDNLVARRVLAKRWKQHPLCRAAKVSGPEECLTRIRREKLITPDALANDKRLYVVDSNYP